MKRLLMTTALVAIGGIALANPSSETRVVNLDSDGTAQTETYNVSNALPEAWVNSNGDPVYTRAEGETFWTVVETGGIVPESWIDTDNLFYSEAEAAREDLVGTGTVELATDAEVKAVEDRVSTLEDNAVSIDSNGVTNVQGSSEALSWDHYNAATGADADLIFDFLDDPYYLRNHPSVTELPNGDYTATLSDGRVITYYAISTGEVTISSGTDLVTEKELDAALTPVETKVATNKSDIASNKSAIETNATDIANTNAYIDILVGEISTNESNIEIISTRIDGLDITIKSIQNQIDDADTFIEANGIALVDLQAQINAEVKAREIADAANEETRVAELNASISAAADERAILRASIKDAELLIETNKGLLESLQSDLEAEVRKASTERDNLQDNIDALATEVSANETRISELQTQIDGVTLLIDDAIKLNNEALINQYQSVINTAANERAALEGQIISVEKAVEAAVASIDSLISTTEELNLKIDRVEASIRGDLATQIELTEEKINVNTQAIKEEYEARVAALTKLEDELKQAIADAKHASDQYTQKIAKEEAEAAAAVVAADLAKAKETLDLLNSEYGQWTVDGIITRANKEAADEARRIAKEVLGNLKTYDDSALIERLETAEAWIRDYTVVTDTTRSDAEITVLVNNVLSDRDNNDVIEDKATAGAIDKLDDRVTANEEKLADHEERITSNTDRITALEDKLNEFIDEYNAAKPSGGSSSGGISSSDRNDKVRKWSVAMFHKMNQLLYQADGGPVYFTNKWGETIDLRGVSHIHDGKFVLKQEYVDATARHSVWYDAYR